MRRSPELILFLAVSLFAAPARAQFENVKPPDVPEIAVDSVPNFLKTPQGVYLGEPAGVAQDSKGNIFVFHRSNETRLFEFDKEGNYTREIGRGCYAFLFAHTVRIDPQDNIWVVDEGSNMIVEFNPQGRIVFLLGRRPPASEGVLASPLPGTPVPPAQPYFFNRPTDVAWDSDGNIFVSDGYGNSRVVKFDKNGRFIKEVGSKGTEPGQFNTPHSIAIDAKNNVYVADRGNWRIQVFDDDLTLRAVYGQGGTIGRNGAICISPGPHQYLYSASSNPTGNLDIGQIYKMELDGTVLGKFGRAGKALKEYGAVHEVSCRNENELLVGELLNWRVQKVILHPAATAGR
jgi:DNA-binding beta-propeller fold protein YncE